MFPEIRVSVDGLNIMSCLMSEAVGHNSNPTCPPDAALGCHVCSEELRHVTSTGCIFDSEELTVTGHMAPIRLRLSTGPMTSRKNLLLI